MIYFDNAATGGFKPSSVENAVINTIKYLNANPSRSSHRLALKGAEITFECRNAMKNFFNGYSTQRVVFTKNCTEALNIAILGSLKKGDRVLTTIKEHNSVLRPLFYLKSKGIIDVDIIEDDEITLEKIDEKLTDNTTTFILNHASNVTGKVTQIHEIGKYLKRKNIRFILDGAQSAGHIKIDMQKDNISALAVAGHKGIYGLQGSGVLLFKDDFDLSPITFGGSGNDTFEKISPLSYPEKLESGTLNLPAIVSLFEGVRFISKKLDAFSSATIELTSSLINKLKNNEKVKLYSNSNECGIVSFSIENLPSQTVADILNDDYDVAVRAGYHCAPLTHKYLKTEKDGLVRASLSPFNTQGEIDYFVSAINSICEKIQ